MISILHEYAKRTFYIVAPKLVFRRKTTNTEKLEIELELLPLLVDPDRESVDVGANLGVYSDRLAKLSKHTYAFEAHPRLCRMLRSVLPPSVAVTHAAVSDKIGYAELHVPVVDGNHVEALGSLEEPIFSNRPRETIRVPTQTLDSLASRNIGFIKIDVEGHELNVLLGSDDIIRTCRPTFLIEIEERHRAGCISQVTSFLLERQYKCIFVHGRELLDFSRFTPDMQDTEKYRNIPRRRSPYANNFVFIPAEKYSHLLHEKLADLLRRI